MANARELAERTENALREIADAKDAAALDAVRVRYVGRRDGELTTRMKAVSALPAAERPAAGAALNAAKSAIETAIADRERALRAATLDRSLSARSELHVHRTRELSRCCSDRIVGNWSTKCDSGTSSSGENKPATPRLRLRWDPEF